MCAPAMKFSSRFPVAHGLRPGDSVFLVRAPGPKPTWFTLHDMPHQARPSTSMVAVFMREDDAAALARGLEAYRREHGRYPPREFARQTKRLTWLRDLQLVEAAAGGVDEVASVTEMPLSDVMAMLKGSGAYCRLLFDLDNLTHRIDLVQSFDKAAVCSKLEHDLSLQPAEEDVPPCNT